VLGGIRRIAGSCAAVWFAVLLAVSVSLAQEEEIKIARPKIGSLKMRLKNSTPALRSDAPFSIEVEFDSTYPDLLDGELALTFVDDTDVCLRRTVGPIVIPSGQKSLRIPLPSMAARKNPATFVVQVEFRSNKATFDLGTHDVVVPLMGQRQVLVAAPGLGEVPVGYLVRQLQLDDYRPPGPRRPDLLALPVELDPHDFPVDTIGFYPYDVLVFVGEHFSRLSVRQLEILGDWVEQGGAAVVVPTGVLTLAHLRFIDRLVGSNADAPLFVADAMGRLPAVRPGSKDWAVACRYEFGRALILKTMPEFASDGSPAGLDKSYWTRIVTFLWNVRLEQASKILKNGTWDLPSMHEKNDFATDARNAIFGPPTSLHPFEFAKAGSLRQLLFPDAVRVVPFQVVATILTLFLLALAPGDYFVLGFLRRRRYTWIVFPTVCLIFTVATVWIARHYTGTVDHRSALVIVDVGERGRPLRTTRIDHVITAGTISVTTDVRNGLFSLTDVQPSAAENKKASTVDDTITSVKMPKISTIVYSRPSRPYKFRSLDEEDPRAERPVKSVEYAGLFPANFSVSQLSRQWTPAMHRVTLGGTDVDVPHFPWAEIDALDASSQSSRIALAERVRRVVPDCDLLIQRGENKYADLSWSSAQGGGGRFQYWPEVLGALSSRVDQGLFAILSQISPNGAGDLEDLSVFDSADAGACLVHLVVRQGDDLVVFRRFVRPNRRIDLGGR